MDKYLIIDKNVNGGIKIKDTITDIAVTYYDYSEREAIKSIAVIWILNINI